MADGNILVIVLSGTEKEQNERLNQFCNNDLEKIKEGLQSGDIAVCSVPMSSELNNECIDLCIPHPISHS
jgi:hypothetical protein